MTNKKSSRRSVVQVSKRDGTIEEFTPAKLVQCIQWGLQAGGESTDSDTLTARGLAEAVQEYLQNSHVEAPVPSPHLAELVELVLTQTGYTGACMAIRQHFWLRDRFRRRLLVATPKGPDGRFVQRRWNKAHLVQHLRRRHALDTPASRMIAGRVEQLIFSCGLKVVTAGLVLEMTRSELLAWGLMPGALVVKRQRHRFNRDAVRDSTDPI
jgi:hypothetical protein